MLKLLKEVEASEDELLALQSKIRLKQLKCSNLVEINGDIRFWGVDTSESPILSKFKDLIESQAFQILGHKFKNVILMVNHIDAKRSPDGSGGGWHIDSVKNQYKVFMYLTDCLSNENGPFTVLLADSYWKNKFHIIKNYILNERTRFSAKNIRILENKGFVKRFVLQESLKPFLINTSYIHRGESIKIGERIMVTAYMFDKVPRSIANRTTPVE